MTAIALFLNLPWSLIGLVGSMLSIPRKIIILKNPPALIFHVRSFWWYRWLPGMTGVRAMTNGNVIQMSTWADEADLKHELIHIEQHARQPFMYPLLYLIEQMRNGSGPQNKYEREAYERAGNKYRRSAPENSGSS